MIERCAEFDTCDKEKPFIAVGKPVFAIEYNQSSDDCGAATPVAQLASAVCRHQLPASIADGLYKDVELTSKVWAECEPVP
jgi:Glycoside-hydrolase family GH114